MLTLPELDPVAISFGPLQVRWYGLMYLLGFVAFYFLGVRRARLAWQKIEESQVADLLFYGVIGIIVGGRAGYVLFYNFPAFAHDPLMLFRVWEGGMSFHGGLLGAVVALSVFARGRGLGFLQAADFAAPLVPIGLGAGRIGNFINGELWGRATDLPWAMVFPAAGNVARHPSQLYEFLLEGVVLFAILWFYSSRPRRAGAVSGAFALLYAGMRFAVEFVREPDAHIGYIAWGWLTMGQLLSLPLAAAGVALIAFGVRADEHHTRAPASRRPPYPREKKGRKPAPRALR